MAKNFWITVLLIASTLLYSYRLGNVPVHLNQDELMFSLNAYSIAQNGKDYYGSFLPFYFWHLGSFWATPIIVYWTSLFLKILPLSEFTIRIPSVVLGLISAGLLMFLVEKIFKDRRLTLFCGILFVTTPVVFINSRLLLDNIYPIPFAILWLVSLFYYNRTETKLGIFWAGLSLGIGIHSYHAAKIMMPLYFFATTIFFARNFWSNKKGFLVFTLGFLIPIILFIPWLKAHPDTLLNQVSYLGSIDRTIDPAKGFWGIANLNRFKSFATSYISYFSPKILFTEGDRSLIHSTGETGAFLFPIFFLLVFGVFYVITQKDKFSKIILFGFLTYPLAPAIVLDPQRISRGLVVVPFAILLSVYGAKYLFSSKDILLRRVLTGLIILGLIQFAFFLNNYFGEYRKGSYAWFNYDVGGAIESALRSTQIRKVERIYLDEYSPFIDLYFKFYEIKFGISAPFSFYDFRSDDLGNYPSGSLVVIRTDHLLKKEERHGDFELIEVIRESDGNESFYIYYRDQ